MSQQPSPSLPDLLDKLLDDHIAKEKAYYGELHRRTDAYKAQLEKCKQAIAERRSQHKREIKVKNEQRQKKLRELYHIAHRMAGMWIAQDPDDRNLDLPGEDTPFQDAVQVLISDHHLTIVDDSGNLDIDGGNPAEEQVRAWLVNQRLGGLTGTTPLEAELKRLDTPTVVHGLLLKLWARSPDDCEGMRLPKHDAARTGNGDENSSNQRKTAILSPKAIKRPPERAFKAWRLRDLTGITNQTAIAEKMTELGDPCNQGQVSRWLGEVKAYLKAGGVLPEIPAAKRETAIDPAVIEMGARQDGRSPHQREKKSADSED